MATQFQLKLDESAWKALDNNLAKIEANMRSDAIDKALKQAGKLIAATVKSSLPKPGYPGDKPGLKPLRDTITAKVAQYDGERIKVLIVGYKYPEGAHGHLVESGHRIVVRTKAGKVDTGRKVEGRDYLKKAVETTQTQVEQILITVGKSLIGGSN